MQTNNINVLVDIIHFIQSISYSKIDVSVSIIVVSDFFIINSNSAYSRLITSSACTHAVKRQSTTTLSHSGSCSRLA